MNQNQPKLEFAANNAHTGFRLRKLEVLNWGTFNKKIWKISSDGSNTLLTGDIGSGKSTLVDAITTLLVPHHKITFNKAAGSEKKERTLYSYIRGEYKIQKNTDTNTSKSVYLRNDNDNDYCGYSVLLGYFFNDGYKTGVTVAQVFWLKDDKPEKMFIISEKELNITDDFSGFGNDMNHLRKKLKNGTATETYSSFKEYNMEFRHRFGINSEKALDLFYQTVSMKSVGDLTQFVRDQMLEKTEVSELISALKNNFENLTRAHDAVEKAERQKKELLPLSDAAGKYEKESIDLLNLNDTFESIPHFTASKKIVFLKNSISKNTGNLEISENRFRQITTILEDLRKTETDLSIAINNDSAGQRLHEIEKETELAEKNKNTRLQRHNEYSSLAEKSGFTQKPSRDDFYANLNKAKTAKSETSEKVQKNISDRDELVIECKDIENHKKRLELEIDSLKNRESSISKKNLDIRSSIAQALEISEAEIPFAGELLKVKDDESEWEGAIERILHNFGLSLLVPDSLYKRVSNYVNKTDLKGRLVYFRISADVHNRNSAVMEEKNTLINKIEIKSDSIHYSWVENEIRERFNYFCCDTMEEFFHRTNAVTKEGQIKGARFRHEKDDRRSIHDRSNYILGWSNKSKILSLNNELSAKAKSLNEVLIKLDHVKTEAVKLNSEDRNLDFFIRYTDFDEIDWYRDAELIRKLNEEKTVLKNSSDKLKTLEKQIAEIRRSINENSDEKDNYLRQISVMRNNLQSDSAELERCGRLLQSLAPEKQAEYFPVIEKIIGKRPCTPDSINPLMEEIRSEINTLKNDIGKRIQNTRDRIIRMMNQYKNNFPEDTTEVDCSIDSVNEFKSFLTKIEEDDLPKYKERFRALLKEKTIQDIALFKQQLENFASDIEEKISEINKSLKAIEYNSGSYITLIAEKVTDVEIREFKTKLTACLEGTLQEELYSEEKFRQVKEILDRFKNDLNWTDKVTDVRNWFDFLVIEKWKEDDSEKEIYSSSSGKSGGQKEKLAYTILASALAYQFGLKWNEIRSKSFRFVVIDEAFGRGSDESTRYALELFRKLDLQLLIVTPLQKIYIIEDYVTTISHVTNFESNNSLVRTLTWEEYQNEKTEWIRKRKNADIS